MVMKHALRRGASVLAAASALTWAAALPGHAATAASPPGWRTVKVYPNGTGLFDVAATSASDAFVAGIGSSSKPDIVSRWNGSAWLTLPQLPAHKGVGFIAPGARLVAASSATNAWFFGLAASNPVDGVSAGLSTAQRWNGKAWVNESVFPANVVVNGAVTASATNAWAFGAPTSPVTFQPTGGYAAHFNGHAWTRVSFPIVGAAASALSGSDIWVVGYPSASRTLKGATNFAVEHYVKGAWHKLQVPSFSTPKTVESFPDGIIALSDTNVWATAALDAAPGGGIYTGIALLHYNGKSWKRVTIPYPAGFAPTLAQDGAGGFWLSTDSSAEPQEQYVYHYASNGKWSRVEVPHGKNIEIVVSATAWIPGTKSLWSVGVQQGTAIDEGVILKYGT
jgi:hypothetical protein